MSRATQHRGGGERSHLPPDQLVEDLDKFLYLIDPAGGLGLRGKGDMGPSALRYRPPAEKATDEEDVKEDVHIFEEFQGRSCLDELVRNCPVVALGDSLQVLVYLVSEY